MITVVVLGVLIAMAIPSFQYVTNSSRITTPANELLAGMQLAKIEAVRRNARVVMCGSSNGTGCSGSGTWDGWIMFADTDRDGVADNNEPIIRSYSIAAPATMQSSSNISNGKLMFRSDGFPRDTSGNLLEGIIRVCVPVTTPSDNGRDITVSKGGRAFIARHSGSGACAAPSNPS